MEVLHLTVRFVFNLRNRRTTLHALGLLLNLSGIFRFWLNFQPLESLWLLLFNWGVCILLECVAVELLFQISWTDLRLHGITGLRCLAFVVIFTMGIINIYTMWQVCMQVHDCVILSHQDYNWVVITPPLWLAMATAMCHAIVLAICIPCQMVIIPLECNKNIPNINFRSHVTLAVNAWLFIHFGYLFIKYSYCSYDAITLFYRLCCTLWMVLYCYPDGTYSVYCCFKQWLPKWVRSFLRPIRMTRVWTNVKIVMERRRRDGITIDVHTNLLNILRTLWNMINRNVSLWLPFSISCISVTCLLKCFTGWEFTLLLLMVISISSHFVLILYLMFFPCFLQPLAKHACQLMAPINNCSHETAEETSEIQTLEPIECTDK